MMEGKRRANKNVSQPGDNGTKAMVANNVRSFECRGDICFCRGNKLLSREPNTCSFLIGQVRTRGFEAETDSRKMADTGGIVGKADIRSAMFNPGGWKSLLTFVILALAWLAGFSSRLFAVIRFESIIHEFDPW